MTMTVTGNVSNLFLCDSDTQVMTTIHRKWNVTKSNLQSCEIRMFPSHLQMSCDSTTCPVRTGKRFAYLYNP